MRLPHVPRLPARLWSIGAMVLGAAAGVAPAVAARAATPSPAPAARSSAVAADVSTPSATTLYRDGPGGRFLMDGTWLFRFDRGLGLRDHYESQRATTGWSPITVPNAWNATDQSDSSFAGNVGWYRHDFRLPSSAARFTWIVRFESVNYTARVWLNGHALGTHTGTFLPFEVVLPARDLSRTGANRLVVRVDSHHGAASLPPFSISTKGTPVGGWWNYGGILREVYLRRVDRVDFTSVTVRPDLPCPSCTARMVYTADLTNYSPTRQSVRVLSSFGTHRVDLGTHTIAPGRQAVFAGRVAVAHPRLWAPGHPYLYKVTLAASASAGGRPAVAAAHYLLASGIRSIRLVSGHLYLNGAPLHLRGVGLQEDSPQNGFAIGDPQRAAFINAARDLGADLIRSQYPLSPYEEELADRDGILLWSEVPVFSVKEDVLSTASFRRFAEAQLAQNIVDNGNHPSVLVWSIANELSSRPEHGQLQYIQEATKLVHTLDPSRPVGLAVAGYPSVTCQPAYRSLGVIGINDYFGWYPGPSGQIADPSLLSGYLDGLHSCYRHQALFVTEFGAEANRNGPVQERGTYQFQNDFVRFHLGVFATKPFLSAAVYWALEDFRVRPGWSGGNPLPDPPVFQKGLLDFNGLPRPAYYSVQAIYRATRQVG